MNTNNNSVAIIAGATGLTGSTLVDELLKRNLFSKIKLITRHQLNINDPRVEQIMIQSLDDLDDIQSNDLRFQADTFFCCLGTTIKSAGSKENFKKVDYEGIMTFAKLAKVFLAQHFILISAMGANPKSLFFYSKVKGETEESIIKMNIPGTVIFRPSLLIGERKENRPLEVLFIKTVRCLSKFMPFSIQKNLGTRVETLIRKMIDESQKTEKDLRIINASEIS